MWQGDVLKAFLLRHRFDILSITLGTSCPIRICHPGPGTQAASSMPSSDRALNSPSALFPPRSCLVAWVGCRSSSLSWVGFLSVCVAVHLGPLPTKTPI